MLALRALTDSAVDLAGARVLVRASLNVPLADRDARQRFRIAAVKATVDFLIAAGARVALIGHLGRPTPGASGAALSLSQLTDDIAQIIARPVAFVNACIGDAVASALAAAQGDTVLLLENVRFHAAERSDDPAVRRAFAQRIAQNFDYVVNDAFSVCHRAQASVVELMEVAPSFAGVQLMREVATLAQVVATPARPAVAVIGGAKITTKLPLIRALEARYDAVLVGGKVANEALDAQENFAPSVHLPTDFIEERYDIGAATVRAYVAQIMAARTVVWNGPLGWYEKDAYAHGTRAIVRALARTKAFTVVGGGESVEVLEREGVLAQIDFVSTGGGAMLDFMAGVPLPGLAPLVKNA